MLQKTFYCNDHTITEFGIIDSKNSSTAYVILYELIDTWFLDSNRRVGVWSLPWRWHILSIPLTTGRGTGRNLWAGWCVSSWWLLFPSRSSVLIYIYIYMHFRYEFCFLWFTDCVLLSDDNSLIPGLLAFVLKNSLILGIWCSTIPHLPRCFYLWIFSEYRIQHGAIGHLYVTSSYSLRRLVSWINHLPPACWSTFWKSIFKQQLGCRFAIMESISSFFCILTYAIIYVLIHHIILGFIFILKYCLFFQVLLY